jgi:hypothetical protein
LDTLVDNSAPITFAQLAHRFAERGMSSAAYQTFNLPLRYADITDPDLADEIVGYRSLVAWFNAPERP